jgi:hypothetical protein
LGSDIAATLGMAEVAGIGTEMPAIAARFDANRASIVE